MVGGCAVFDPSLCLTNNWTILIKNLGDRYPGTCTVEVIYIKDSFLAMMTVLLECTCTSYIPGKCTHNVHNFI